MLMTKCMWIDLPARYTSKSSHTTDSKLVAKGNVEKDSVLHSKICTHIRQAKPEKDIRDSFAVPAKKGKSNKAWWIQAYLGNKTVGYSRTKWIANINSNEFCQ